MTSDRVENLERSRKIMQGSTPRQVRIKGPWEGRKAWGDAVFLLSVFLFFFVLLAYNELPLAAARWGVPAKAEITGKKMVETHMLSSPQVEIRYQIGNETEETEIDTISRAFYAKAQAGDRVAIHYLPSFPSKPSMDVDPPSLWMLLIFFLTFPFPWVVIWWNEKEKKLLPRGWLVEGVVTAIIKKPVYWEFKAKMAAVQFVWKGRIYQNTSTLKNYGVENKPGDPILFLVNPLKPEDHMVYDDRACSWRPVQGIENLVT